MSNRPIHENLDTSFVNLSALIKYLRRRQFVGSVKVQLNGYKADIQLREDNQMKVSEHDQISGRISEGEEALQRLLIRAREPGGTINVFQHAEEKIKNEKPSAKSVPTVEVIQNDEEIIEAEIIEAIPKPAQPPQQINGGSTPKQVKKAKASVNLNATLPKVQKNKPKVKFNGNGIHLKKKAKPAKREASLPDFPFRLSNKVEERAKEVQSIANEDWQILLNLTVELLGVIDKSLAQAKLNFKSAFRKASAEIADDYPFLNPANDIFEYSNGRIKMTEQINPKIFVSSIMEVLRRILDKLETSHKFFEVHRATSQRILAVMNKRENLYDKFGISNHLKRMLGV